MLSKKEVQHIAKLARIGLTDKETEKYRKELSSILGYIEKLKKIDISKTEPTSHPLQVENVTRADEGQKTKGMSKKLTDLTPQTKDGYIKVRSILK